MAGVFLNYQNPTWFDVGGPPTALSVISIAVLVPGVAIWIWSVLLILRDVPNGQLITGGPYAWVKHPLYTAVALLVVPWIGWAAESIRQTTGKAPAILPNFGGSLPNDVLSEGLGLPTIWVPHSYPGCSQHAPNEHILMPVTEEALAIMAGLFWDLGEKGRRT